MPRTILHLDLDAFFCCVEELNDPSLHGKPFAVGGRPEERGVVSSCSYPARVFGVRSAMPMGRALRICPGLIIINHHRSNYSEISDRVMDRLRMLSPLVEQISIDEAFVDISGLGDPITIAKQLQDNIRNGIGLPNSIGIASNKLIAKIATDVGKMNGPKGCAPNALTIVPKGTEETFLEKLPTEMLWGVGPKTAQRLKEHGIVTIGDIASHPVADLERWFGETGVELWRHAHGIDERPIITEYEAKSVSQEITFAHDITDEKILRHTLRDLSGQVGRRLRKDDLAGQTIKIKIRWPDFTSLTRQITQLNPINQDDEIYKTALELFQKARPAGKAVRLIGVGVSGFKSATHQLSLWDGGTEKSRKLQDALDAIQDKYGKNVIRRG